MLTYYKYPYQHWKRIRTTNVIERSFKEVKRRTKGIGRFQIEERALTMVLLATEGAEVAWREDDDRG